MGGGAHMVRRGVRPSVVRVREAPVPRSIGPRWTWRCRDRSTTQAHRAFPSRLERALMPPSPHQPAAHGANDMTTIGTGPYTADIGDGIETFETLADVQRAMRARVTGIRSSSEWCRQMRTRHGAKVRDAAGKVVANVSYNGRLWRADAQREPLACRRAKRSHGVGLAEGALPILEVATRPPERGELMRLQHVLHVLDSMPREHARELKRPRSPSGCRCARKCAAGCRTPRWRAGRRRSGPRGSGSR